LQTFLGGARKSLKKQLNWDLFLIIRIQLKIFFQVLGAIPSQKELVWLFYF